MIPTSCWICFRSSCICLRSFRSSAPSGSSSSSTCGSTDERARKRNALLLPARQLPRLAVSEPAEVDELEDPRTRPWISRSLIPFRRGRRRRCRRPSGAGRARSSGRRCSRRACRAAARPHPDLAEQDAPSVGSSKPPIMRSVVVFPQPDGPSKAKNFPAGRRARPRPRRRHRRTASSPRRPLRSGGTSAGRELDGCLVEASTRLGGHPSRRAASRGRGRGTSPSTRRPCRASGSGSSGRGGARRSAQTSSTSMSNWPAVMTT